jgi:creatinine amidohydrolase
LPGRCVILPPLHFTVASFAEGFAGTLSFSPATVRAILTDLTAQLAAQGWRMLAIANAHLDPAHLSCLHDSFQESPLPVVFPDLTRRRLAARLTPEFQSGACHAGQYEGSIVASLRPDLVDWEAARALPDNPSSLVTAIREGKRSFAEAGGPQSYFGSPRGINPEEGQASLVELGRILAEAILAELGEDAGVA